MKLDTKAPKYIHLFLYYLMNTTTSKFLTL